jgi:hypothetical protein
VDLYIYTTTTTTTTMPNNITSITNITTATTERVGSSGTFHDLYSGGHRFDFRHDSGCTGCRLKVTSSLSSTARETRK